MAVKIEFDREDKIDDCDLQNDKKKIGARAASLLRLRFLGVDLAMNFEDGLGDQEETPADQNNVAPADLVAVDDEERRAQSPEECKPEQQRDTKDERQEEPDLARSAAGGRLKAGSQERKKNDIVNAENNFERRQGQQRSPRIRIGEKREHAETLKKTVNAKGRRSRNRSRDWRSTSAACAPQTKNPS